MACEVCGVEPVEFIELGAGAGTIERCAVHAAEARERLAKLDELFTMARVEMADFRCSHCGALMPEGALAHRCDAPAAQPHPDER